MAPIDPTFIIPQIRTTIDSNDEIEFQPGDYYFGDDTVWVKGPKKIKGYGAVIHGSAYKLMSDFIPAPANSNLSDMDFKTNAACGIFGVVGPGLVEISGFTFDHEITKAGASGYHGSATLAHFVDNKIESSILVKNCTFNTNATAAVDIWSINRKGPRPKMHEAIVRGCTVNAIKVTDPLALAYGAGSYCGIVLGNFGMPDRPVVMRGSRFEVTDCNFDPQKFPAIALFNYVSDSESEFRICNNRIGCNSPQGGATSLGILLGFKDIEVYPKGTVLIMDNEINVETYFQWGNLNDQSVGISIPVKIVSASSEPRLETVISGNKINLGHASPPNLGPPAESWCVAGIYYEDKSESGSSNTTAIINDNEISSNGVPPLWGICLRNASHSVMVKDNDLRSLTASHAQIYVDKNGNDCFLTENILGGLESLPGSPPVASPEAVLLCQGDSNWLLDNDFSHSQVPPWKPSGPVFVKLDIGSENNVLVYGGKLSGTHIVDIGMNNHTMSI